MYIYCSQPLAQGFGGFRVRRTSPKMKLVPSPPLCKPDGRHKQEIK